LFAKAYNFNQPNELGDVTRVTYMYGMFMYASKFNQPIESWDISEGTAVFIMFYGASKFNQCLSTWADKIGAASKGSMFKYSGCPLQYLDPDGPWCQGSEISPAVPTTSPTTSSPTASASPSAISTPVFLNLNAATPMTNSRLAGRKPRRARI